MKGNSTLLVSIQIKANLNQNGITFFSHSSTVLNIRKNVKQWICPSTGSGDTNWYNILKSLNICSFDSVSKNHRRFSQRFRFNMAFYTIAQNAKYLFIHLTNICWALTMYHIVFGILAIHWWTKLTKISTLMEFKL